jgi:DNA-binding CsgD family transcriptional regulator
MNRDDLPGPQYELRHYLCQFERLISGPLTPVDRDDRTTALLGVALVGVEGDGLVEGDASRTPSRLLIVDGRHQVVIPLQRLDAPVEVAEPSHTSWIEMDDIEAAATAFRDWWSECGEPDRVEGIPAQWWREQLGSRDRMQTRPVTGWLSLTQNEIRVAELVSLGLTNREIGQRMFLSRYTIDTHLRHIFDKLGIRSRVQLARVAFAQLPPSSH